MPVTIKWFPPSWFQVKTKKLIIYIDPAYLRSYYTHYPKKIEFSKWPGPIDGLPEKLEKAENKSIYHAGDTDFIPEMKKLGSVDVALLPIGGTFTMDLAEAVRAAVAIKPKVVIPMHRSKADPQDFKEKVEKRSNIKVVLLQIGEVYKPT